ncbi:MAG TPA: serpin family protein [Mycobacteriales bacterium]|nr:serpin family protein [Mycobacteriales bacterium]
MRLRSALAAVAVIGLLAGACGHSGGPTDPVGSSKGIALLSHTTGISDPAAAGRMGRADAGFAGTLYPRLAAGDDNLVLSPLSIASVLQMLTLGAHGATAAQLQQALQLPGLSAAQLTDQIGALRTSLAVLARQDQVHTADAIWAQRGFAVAGPYNRALQQAFGAATMRTDFAKDPGSARDQINSAIAAVTHGRIKELIPDDGTVNQATRVVLTDAIYLNAKWAHPFDPHETTNALFTRADGSTVKTPMMKRNGLLAYAQRDGYQVASLPYAGNHMSMQILLPDGPLAPLEQKLRSEGLRRLVAGQSSQQVDFGMPRWNFTSAPNLKPALQTLGIRDAFTDRADLSGISDRQKLFLQAVVHKAMIKVGEKGTEAAAATAGSVGATAAPVADAKMILDRPFLFAITDDATGTPLFLGRVSDPTQS